MSQQRVANKWLCVGAKSVESKSRPTADGAVAEILEEIHSQLSAFEKKSAKLRARLFHVILFFLSETNRAEPTLSCSSLASHSHWTLRLDHSRLNHAAYR